MRIGVPMHSVFINYRVGETAAFARLLDRHCAAVFGRDEVFFASEAIIPGTPFDQAIEDALQICEVLVAVIGPHWVDATDARGSRRLDHPDDWVRREIATALERGIPVIPLLIDNAALPGAGDLSDDISKLTVCNQVRVGHRAGDPDLDTVITAIRRAVPRLASVDETRPCSFAVMEIDEFDQHDTATRQRWKQDLSEVATTALTDAKLDWSILGAGSEGMITVRIPDAARADATVALVGNLHRILAEHAVSGPPGEQMRLRVALHADELPDQDAVRRLVRAPIVRRVLAAAERSHLAVVISPAWYEEAISRLGTRIDSGSFTAVRLGTPKAGETAWVHVPGLSRPPGISRHEEVEMSRPTPQGAPGPRSVTLNDDAYVANLVTGDQHITGGLSIEMPTPRKNVR